MTNIEQLSFDASMKHEGLIDDHGAFDAGYEEGFNEALRQMHKAAICMPDSAPTLKWIAMIVEWAQADVTGQLTVRDTT